MYAYGQRGDNDNRDNDSEAQYASHHLDTGSVCDGDRRVEDNGAQAVVRVVQYTIRSLFFASVNSDTHKCKCVVLALT